MKNIKNGRALSTILIRSHDGFVELPSGVFEPDRSTSPYASQQKVFDDLGRNVLKNAFDGNEYHSLLHFLPLHIELLLQDSIVPCLPMVKQGRVKVIRWLVTVLIGKNRSCNLHTHSIERSSSLSSGIIPIVCDELFRQINGSKDPLIVRISHVQLRSKTKCSFR